jgi:hypothetical protein
MSPQRADAALDPCPLCERPNHHPSDHHMVPRSRGGRATTTLCRDCHTAIHATFSNRELEQTYHAVDALLAHPTFAQTVAFIARQDPGGRVRTARVKGRPRKP